MLATLLLTPADAAVDDELTAAAAAAKTAVEAPHGKQFEEAVGKAFGREHGITIQQCANGAKHRDLSNFEVFLRLDGSGVVDRLLVNPATTLSTCVQGKMAGWKAPAPTAPDYWVKIAVNLKGK